MQRRGFLTLASLLALILLVLYTQRLQPRAPDVTSAASAALQALKAENKLIVYSASLTVMATSKTRPDALINQKLVLVQPVLVHYGVDLNKLQPQHMKFDAVARRLTIVLPDVAIVARDIDPADKEEISDSGVIGKLTGTEETLRKAAETKISPEILKQASSQMIMNLARESAKRQVRSMISGALAATGQSIEVVVQVGPQPAS